MTSDEYNRLFHKLRLNEVAFKRLMDCDEEVLKLVNFAIQSEREACAKLCINIEQSEPLSDRIGWEHGTVDCHAAIRARGEK